MGKMLISFRGWMRIIPIAGLCLADRELIGDRMIGAYLTLCPEYTFVCENSLDGSIVGYACVAPDARTFYTRHNVAWLPEMRLKYPLRKTPSSSVVDEDMLTPIEQLAQSFHNEEPSLPAGILSEGGPASENGQQVQKPVAVCALCSDQLLLQMSMPWGVGHMHISSLIMEMSLPRRLTMLVLACLRASGTLRLFVNIRPEDAARQREFYAGLGFVPLPTTVTSPEVKNEPPMYMSRCF
jgi:protein O-GlcNAcase/histone acetyltransferase